MRHLNRPGLVLFACLFTSQAGLLVLSPILLDVAREFGISTAVAGQLRTISGATGGLTAVVLVVARRRPGLSRLLAAAAVTVAVAALLSATAPSFLVLATAQALIGVGIGLFVAAGIAAAWEWPEADDRANVLAWTIAGMPAAWVAGMPLVGLLAEAGWRWTWLLPAAAGLVTLALVRMRPADGPSQRAASARRPEVARFAIGELLASAAWASVLTYSGALLLESYPVSREVVAFGLALVAAAMLPGTFTARRSATQPTLEVLAALTVFQGAAVVVLGAFRPDVAVTLGVLSVMAFTNGRRSMVASALGMDTAPDDRLAMMSMRAAANQFGYLLGAATGGLALAVGGFPALGVALAALFAGAVLVHLPALLSAPTPMPQEV